MTWRLPVFRWFLCSANHAHFPTRVFGSTVFLNPSTRRFFSFRQYPRPVAAANRQSGSSREEDAVRGFQQALTEAQRLWQKADLRHADHNKESAFRAAMWWLQSAQRPAVIFTTCGEHAKGVLAAIEMFQDPASPKTMVVSVENESWIQRAVPSYIHKIPQDFLRLGALAAQKAQELAEGTASAVGNTSLLPSPDPFSPRFSPSSAASMSHSPLRLALLEGAASYALQLMLPRFTGQTGVETETDILSYADMQQFARTPSLCRQYDLLQTNVLWFHPLAEAGVFLPLGEPVAAKPPSLHHYYSATACTMARYTHCLICWTPSCCFTVKTYLRIFAGSACFLNKPGKTCACRKAGRNILRWPPSLPAR